MSEVQTRPAPRGRSSARGGRGGPRGGARAGNRHVNGDPKAASPDTFIEEGEIGELKKRYLTELPVLREMFKDWTDEDLVFALEETNGDVTSTIERITEGNVSQFAEVSKKAKDRARSKVKDPSAGGTDASTRPVRGRGGAETSRGRGRGDRGRGGFRGAARGGAPTAANGVRAHAAKSIPTAESNAWDAITSNKENEVLENTAGEGGLSGQWGSIVASEATPISASEGVKSSLIPDGGPKKTWASMFAKPKVAPAPAPKPEVTAPPAIEPERHVPEVAEPPPPIPLEAEAVAEAPLEPPTEEETPAITPSKDELTEDNVEHLPDYSNKPASETVASLVGSGRDIGSATPSILHQPIGRPPATVGGFATSALKATTPSGRSASFQRRIIEQQEAVVMPGSNHGMDKATVQFGMMGLNGDALDVDEDREEAETRQPPQQSPPSQPRASLPPAPRQPPSAETAPEVLPTSKQQGLPSAPQQALSQQQQSPNPIGAQIGGQGTQSYSQFGRYGQTETAGPPQKPYDPFGQQASQSPLEAYNSSTQGQQPSQSHLGAQSSAPNDYSSYQTSDYQRNAYQNYYGNYGQQQHANQQDVGSAQQRTGSGFGSAPGDSGYASQSQQSSAPSRYGESQNSGQNTPNPALGGGSQAQQAQHLHQQHPQQGQHAGGQYPYGANHPYYNSPYYHAYMNQYNYGGQGFAGPYGGGKAGMYGQPHHGYGISPQQTSYDQHSSSPANAGGFGQSSLHSGEQNVRGGISSLGDYGRSGSTQPTQSSQAGSSSFGGMGDVFSRQSGFPGGNQSYGQQQSGQQSGAEESLKPFGESKPTSGPSPALGQPGRPGSATNNTAGQGQAQTGLPPPQGHQQGFGGYPSQFGQGSQYAGLGGLGHQGGQNQGGFGGYGGYGNYGSYGRGGWGTNYGTH